MKEEKEDGPMQGVAIAAKEGDQGGGGGASARVTSGEEEGKPGRGKGRE